MKSYDRYSRIVIQSRSPACESLACGCHWWRGSWSRLQHKNKKNLKNTIKASKSRHRGRSIDMQICLFNRQWKCYVTMWRLCDALKGVRALRHFTVVDSFILEGRVFLMCGNLQDLHQFLEQLHNLKFVYVPKRLLTLSFLTWGKFKQ